MLKHLTKYEKETILLTSEGDDRWEVYTFNPGLKRRLKEFAEKFPEQCHLKCSTAEGSVTYVVDKARLSIRLTAPYSEERRDAAREAARKNGLNDKNNRI